MRIEKTEGETLQTENERKPDYSLGMRRLRGFLDINQKQMAAMLEMTPQQLSALEKNNKWSEEILQRVSEKLNIPLSGIDYLASEPDLLGSIIQHNTLGNDGNIGHINSNYNNNNFNFGKIENAEDIVSVIKTVISKYDLKPDSSGKEEKEPKKMK